MSIAPALWGLLGAACLEGIEFTKAIKRSNGWPWKDPQEPGPAPYLTAIGLRLAASTGYAQVLVTANGSASAAVSGFVAGITAPLAIEALARQGTGSRGAANRKPAAPRSRSSGNQPSGNQPSGNQPSGNQPSGNRPSGNRPSRNRTSTSPEVEGGTL